MRYAVVVIVDTDGEPQSVAREIVTALEYDGKATVLQAVILPRDGTDVATYKKED